MSRFHMSDFLISINLPLQSLNLTAYQIPSFT